jgi:hypothetical protein
MVAAGTVQKFAACAEPNEKERPVEPLFSWISQLLRYWQGCLKPS